MERREVHVLQRKEMWHQEHPRIKKSISYSYFSQDVGSNCAVHDVGNWNIFIMRILFCSCVGGMHPCGKDLNVSVDTWLIHKNLKSY